jgi:hypothetical protein
LERSQAELDAANARTINLQESSNEQLIKAQICQGDIINQKNIEIDSLREDLDLEKNENATKAMEIDRLRRELIELKVVVT